MLTFRELQFRHAQWAAHNFPNETPRDVFLGIVEEVGELSHAILKAHQKIRGTAAEHEAAERDAIADMILYVTHYCELRGFDLQEIVEETAASVHRRDWVANPADGSAPTIAPVPESAS